MTDISAIDMVDPENPGKDAEFGDFFRLLKPRVMSLVVLTALAGMVAVPVMPHPVIALGCLICIAVGAGASGALNMWWDADIDAHMRRTAQRPIPSGRVEAGDALAIGLGLSMLSVAMLSLFGNLLAAGLLAFTIFFYAVIYTMWLKRSTPQNIVIGGAAGAFPPVIGWLAMGGSLDLAPCLMFLLIFLWTPPHFWALALFRNDEYRRLGIPMMPVVAGDRKTRVQMFLYALVLFPVALALAFTPAGGAIYFGVAALGSGYFLFCAWKVLLRDEAQSAADSNRAEKKLFGVSIVYLFAVFGALIAEALIRLLAGPYAWPVWF